MWIIAEDRRGINLSMSTHLDVCLSDDVQDNLPRRWAVVARYAWHSTKLVVVTCDTEKQCYQLIQDMTNEMCGWIAPQNEEEI